MPPATPDSLLDGLSDRTARGIAGHVSRRITSGELHPGARLPTVRDLARSIGVSPTTVSEAWQALVEAGAIDTRGRLGTFVLGPPRPGGPRRYRAITDARARYRLDLSTGTPDPDLLPDLSSALAQVARHGATPNYLEDPVHPPLGETLASEWPFTPEALTVTNGALDALDRIISSRVRLGDRVLIETPTFPPILDQLDLAGAEIIGVPVDASGPSAATVAEAAAHTPVLFITQPRAHNPLGTATTARRAAALARALAGTDTIIVEDDHASAVSTAPLASIGRHLPERTVFIRSFSKTHGPDLRLAAVGGAASVIEPLVARRQLGAGWSSRLLQAVLNELLTERSATSRLLHARSTYEVRRQTMIDALAARGVQVRGSDGINLWLPVADERSAQLQLAARGIGVAPGTPFLVGEGGSRGSDAADHVRVTIATVDPASAPALAAELAAAAHG